MHSRMPSPHPDTSSRTTHKRLVVKAHQACGAAHDQSTWMMREWPCSSSNSRGTGSSRNSKSPMSAGSAGGGANKCASVSKVSNWCSYKVLCYKPRPYPCPVHQPASMQHWQLAHLVQLVPRHQLWLPLLKGSSHTAPRLPVAGPQQR